jgi:hypothetical protein
LKKLLAEKFEGVTPIGFDSCCYPGLKLVSSSYLECTKYLTISWAVFLRIFTIALPWSYRRVIDISMKDA